jgi:calcineurin-like phosphoesterase family protein
MTKVYVCSDFHFGHENIREYCNRPFANVEEMDNYMIKTYNTTVQNDSKVYFLGDVGFGSKDRLIEIVSQLKGKKVLIMGNHDRRKTTTWWQDVGFDEVIKTPICVYENIWLSHEPMKMDLNSSYINVHGHVHNNSLDSKLHFNVSVEAINYQPIEIITIKKLVGEGKNAI